MKLPLTQAIIVLIALLLLLSLTTGLTFVPCGGWNWLISLAISFAMTGLIMLFTMKVRSSEPLIWLASAAGFTWLSFLLLLVLLDYLSRPWPR